MADSNESGGIFEDAIVEIVEEPSSDDELVYEEMFGRNKSVEEEDFEKIDLETESNGYLEFLETQSSKVSNSTLSAKDFITLMREEHKKEVSKMEEKHKVEMSTMKNEVTNMEEKHKVEMSMLKNEVESLRSELGRFRLVSRQVGTSTIPPFISIGKFLQDLPAATAKGASSASLHFKYKDRPLFTYGPPEDTKQPFKISWK